MRIAYFTDTFLPRVDGVTFTILGHSQILSSRGYKIRIYAPSYSKRAKTESIKNIIIERHPSIPLPTYKDAHITFPKTLSMYKSLKNFNPDVIHFHTPGTVGLLGILLAKVLKKPLIGTYHTFFSETLMYASPKELLKLLNIKLPDFHASKKEGENSFAKEFTSRVVNKIYNQSDLIIAPSLPVKEILKKQGIKKNIEVLPSGIDTTTFFPNRNKKKEKIILHVGRIGYEKNIDVVIKVFKRVLKEIPDAKLIIAGDGPALPDLRKLSSEIKITQNIEFMGMLDRKNLPQLYRNASVFITASTMETLGLVVLEAMASGLPIVAVDKYALSWLIKHSENGFLVKPFDETTMSKYLVEILKNKILCKNMGIKSRKLAITYDVKKVVVKIEKIYKDLISKK